MSIRRVSDVCNTECMVRMILIILMRMYDTHDTHGTHMVLVWCTYVPNIRICVTFLTIISITDLPDIKVIYFLFSCADAENYLFLRTQKISGAATNDMQWFAVTRSDAQRKSPFSTARLSKMSV